MSPRERNALPFIVIAVAMFATGDDQGPDAQERARTTLSCIGSYADDLSLASVDARRRDESTRYSYALRSRATYQCPYFDRDGNLRRRREQVVSHGTAFALRREGGMTFLVTNEHATEWPQVTTPEDRVEGIPLGCKRISDRMSLVENEADGFEADDIEVQRVLTDPELDVSIVKTTAHLPLLPFKLGQSSGLRGGNAIEIRGFPLGAFPALSTGKVTNAKQRDEEQGWSHTDMVIDAQLSRGQSGSPVLAVSCATRELELVGLYHAGYREGASLNVAVVIDDLREILTTLKPRRRTEPQRGPSAGERARVEASLAGPATVPFVPFGSLTIGVRRGTGGTLIYDIFGKRFPLSDRRLLVLEDLPAPSTFGTTGRAWVGGGKGLCELRINKLEEADHVILTRSLAALREHLVRAVRVRELDSNADKSYARYEKQRVLDAEIQRTEATRRDLARSLTELTERIQGDSLGSCLEPSAIVAAPPTKP